MTGSPMTNLRLHHKKTWDFHQLTELTLDGHSQTKDSWCTKIQQNPQAHQRCSHTSPILHPCESGKAWKSRVKPPFPQVFFASWSSAAAMAGAHCCLAAFLDYDRRQWWLFWALLDYSLYVTIGFFRFKPPLFFLCFVLWRVKLRFFSKKTDGSWEFCCDSREVEKSRSRLSKDQNGETWWRNYRKQNKKKWGFQHRNLAW